MALDQVEPDQGTDAEGARDQPLEDANARVEHEGEVAAAEDPDPEQAGQSHVPDGAGEERRHQHDEHHPEGAAHQRPGAALARGGVAGGRARGGEQPGDEDDADEHLQEEEHLLEEREDRRQVPEAVDQEEPAQRVQSRDDGRIEERPHDPEHRDQHQRADEVPQDAGLLRVEVGDDQQAQDQRRRDRPRHDQGGRLDAGVCLDPAARPGAQGVEEPGEAQEEHRVERELVPVRGHESAQQRPLDPGRLADVSGQLAPRPGPELRAPDGHAVPRPELADRPAPGLAELGQGLLAQRQLLGGPGLDAEDRGPLRLELRAGLGDGPENGVDPLRHGLGGHRRPGRVARADPDLAQAGEAESAPARSGSRAG